MPMLELSEIHTYYGNIEALKGVTLAVEEGECVTLIGSNGAGKSTTLRSISGLTPAREGTVMFEGREITRTAPQDIVQMGISQSPEGRRLFPRMTVRENLDMGAYLRRGGLAHGTMGLTRSNDAEHLWHTILAVQVADPADLEAVEDALIDAPSRARGARRACARTAP